MVINRFRKISLLLSVLALLYGFILILESFLKKTDEIIFIENLILDESPTNHRNLGLVHENYYLKTSDGTFSVDELTYQSFEIGDSLVLRKTLLLHHNFDLSDFKKNKIMFYGSIFNHFPIFPVVLIVCFFAQLIAKNEVLYLILRPLSLVIAFIIIGMSIWVNF